MRKSIIFFLTLFYGTTLLAQQEIRSFGNLQLHTGGVVTAFGNLTNTSAAMLLNNGSLYVKGTLTNDQASMAAGTGILFLNGTSAQSVAGSAFFRTYNLNTDNAAGITLNNDLSIAAVHTFTNGLIATSVTPNYLIYEAGSSHTGSNDSRHVTGWVKKNGTTDFTFPVGDNSYLRSAAVSNLSLSSEINCKYFTPTSNTINLMSPLVQVKANEYWQIDKVSGGTAQITLNWDHSKVPMDNVLVSEIVVAHYTGGNWTDAGGTASGNVSTTGTVTSNATGTFSPFTLGYKAFPVPLKLISFTGERSGGITYLKWITENEENVSHFEVQRSYDAVAFNTIGTVSGRNRGQREQYDLQDHIALQGLAYYRLRSIDRDGKFSYSRVIVVSDNSITGGSFVVINPVRTALTIINRTGREGQFGYSLYNMTGQQIINGTISMTASGGAVLPLPAQIAKGLYILELKNADTKFSQKILIDR